METEFTMLIALVMALVIDTRKYITMDITTNIAAFGWIVSVEGRQPSHPML